MIEHFKEQADAGYKKYFYVIRTLDGGRPLVEVKSVEPESVNEKCGFFMFERYQKANDQTAAWPIFYDSKYLEYMENQKQKISTKEAIEHLIEVMKKDQDYAWSWQCNLAMSFYDELTRNSETNHQDSHKIANLGAANFMNNLFQIDVKQFSEWKDFNFNNEESE